MVFKTQYDEREPVFTEAGSEWHQTYKAKFDKAGNYDLVPDEVINTQEIIESQRDSVDIHVILAKYTNGDESVLNKKAGFFADVSSIPTNMIDMMNFMNDSKDQFNSLPLEVRERFGFNFANYAASIGTDEWSEKMGLVKNEPVVASVDSSVSENNVGGAE